MSSDTGNNANAAGTGFPGEMGAGFGGLGSDIGRNAMGLTIGDIDARHASRVGPGQTPEDFTDTESTADKAVTGAIIGFQLGMVSMNPVVTLASAALGALVNTMPPNPELYDKEMEKEARNKAQADDDHRQRAVALSNKSGSASTLLTGVEEETGLSATETLANPTATTSIWSRPWRATIATSGRGLLTPAPVKLKTLLGGS